MQRRGYLHVDACTPTLAYFLATLHLLAHNGPQSRADQALLEDFKRNYPAISRTWGEWFVNTSLKVVVHEVDRYGDGRREEEEVTFASHAGQLRIDYRLLSHWKKDQVGYRRSKVWVPNGMFVFLKSREMDAHQLSTWNRSTPRSAFLESLYLRHPAITGGWTYFELTLGDYLFRPGTTLHDVVELVQPSGHRCRRVDFSSTIGPAMHKGWFLFDLDLHWALDSFEVLFHSARTGLPVTKCQGKYEYEGENDSYPLAKRYTQSIMPINGSVPTSQRVCNVLRRELEPSFSADYFTPAAFGLTDPAAPQGRDLTWPIVLAVAAAALWLLAYYRRRRRRVVPV